MQTAKEYKDLFDSKRYLINCRKCALPKRETPQQTAVDFLWNSVIILALLQLLSDAPAMLMNIITGNALLNRVGYAMIATIIGIHPLYVYI